MVFNWNFNRLKYTPTFGRQVKPGSYIKKYEKPMKGRQALNEATRDHGLDSHRREKDQRFLVSSVLHKRVYIKWLHPAIPAPLTKESLLQGQRGPVAPWPGVVVVDRGCWSNLVHCSGCGATRGRCHDDLLPKQLLLVYTM